jgi:hypothetical protein
MVWLAAIAVGIVAGIAMGGKVGKLTRLRFRWPWIVLAAVIVRAATVLPPLNRIDGSRWAYVAALTVVLAWTIWHIDRLPGIWLVAAGSALNLFEIAANGGRMPVAPQVASSLIQHGPVGQYTVMGSGTHLNWLADWIVVRWGPLEAYSPGDLIVAVGIAVVIVLAMRSRTRLAETSRRIVSDPP